MAKWPKRIAALTTGALMLGATLAGAFAVADLEDYPEPFVMNGVVSDSVIVVGAAAETADVLGAVDIAAALQAEAVSQIEIEGTTTAPTVTEGVKIEKSGDAFNYGDQVSDIQTTALDDTDLPDLLEEESLDDNEGDNKGEEDYTQELEFGTTADSVFDLQFIQVDDNDIYEEGRPAGSYLFLAEDADVYTYTMLLDSGITVANAADMEGNQLVLQGNTYTITQASPDATLGVDKLTLVAGDSTVWLVQDQPYTVGGHTVTVVDVNNGEDMCGINVDGVTQWVDEGDTEDFGDLSVGVLEVIAVNTKDYDADTCELSLGSSEILLEHGEEVVVNEEKLEGSEVTFTADGSNDWTGFTINYDAGQEDTGINIDDLYLTVGEAWTDPVFGNWKVLFEGVTGDFEEFEFDVSGDDDAEFTFMNNDGEEVEIMWHYEGSTHYLGSDTDKQMLQAGDSGNADIEDWYLLYSTPGGEVHVLQIDAMDCANSDITIDDITYDKDAIADEAAFTCDETLQTVDLGSLGEIKLSFNTSLNYVYDDGPGNGSIESFYEGTFAFNENSVVFTEKAGDEMAVSSPRFNLTYDSSDGLELSVVSGSDFGPEDNDNDDDSSSWYATEKGTLVEIDEDSKWLKVQHPEEDVFGNVFVAPLSATAFGGVAGGTTSDQVNPFSVGLAVLDADAEGMSKNMLVIGGPCANTVAAGLMGNPEDCTEGFEEGKAMLKFFDRNGKDALLVAGYSAEDTMGASRVLADFEDYDMSGDEVEVVVTSLDQISISTV